MIEVWKLGSFRIARDNADRLYIEVGGLRSVAYFVCDDMDACREDSSLIKAAKGKCMHVRNPVTSEFFLFVGVDVLDAPILGLDRLEEEGVEQKWIKSRAWNPEGLGGVVYEMEEIPKDEVRRKVSAEEFKLMCEGLKHEVLAPMSSLEYLETRGFLFNAVEPAVFREWAMKAADLYEKQYMKVKRAHVLERMMGEDRTRRHTDF